MDKVHTLIYRVKGNSHKPKRLRADIKCDSKGERKNLAETGKSTLFRFERNS